MSAPESPLTLAHWRRTVAELYADVRESAVPDIAAAASRYRAARDRLFADHPDSPIAFSERSRWRGSSWYLYDPAWRTIGVVEPIRSSTFEIPLAADGVVRCSRVARVRFSIAGETASLSLYWFEGYGGGLWLPFSDATSGESTYGGGRYLYDTIKGADLGASSDGLVLDFNFAYNPSCAYDDRWACPLSPAENSLAFAVNAGERISSA
jgi:uncharacterized protein